VKLRALIFVADDDLLKAEDTGSAFLCAQRRANCCIRHFGLIAGSWTPETLRAAREAKCATFTKPFTIAKLNRWLDTIARDVDSARNLSDYYINKNPKLSE